MTTVFPRRVLGLFAKEPRPGLAKSRLASASSPEWASRVAEAFLLDLVDRLASLHVCRVLAYAPRSAKAYFEQVVRGRYELEPQADGDLGQRIAAFFTG